MEVEDFLEHHGILGMKWGRRRSRAELSRIPASKKTKTNGKPPWQSPPEKHSKPPTHSATVSGEHKKNHDHIVYEALKAKAKAGGIHSLSNDEIRVLTTRAEALKKMNSTFPKKKTKREAIAKFVIDDLLIATGKMHLKELTKQRSTKYLVSKSILEAKGKSNNNNDED